ncbi:MAG: glycosyltransferase family 39 protein [Candidatus Omnitrophica bacterium]|nr:glycosyltransferase family 39 protein [Candidatus Omnitrophota bacterium]
MRRYTGFILNIGALMLGIWAAARWGSVCVDAAARVDFRYLFNYTEGVMSASVLRIGADPWIYGDLTRWPYILMPYNPAVSYLAYLGTLPGAGVLTAGRLVALLSAAGVSVVLYGLGRSSGMRRRVALVTGLVPFAVPVFSKSTYVFLPDMTALFWTLAGLYEMLRFEKEGRRRYAVFGAAAFVLAVFSKQNFVWGAVAVMMHWAARRRFRRMSALAAAMLLGAGIPMLVLQWLTHGHYASHVFFSPSTISSYAVAMVGYFWRVALPGIWPLLVVAAASLAFDLRQRRSHPLGWYLVLCLVSTLLLGKVGSGDNYFIEVTAALALGAGRLLEATLRSAGRRGAAAAAAVLALLGAQLAADPAPLTPRPSKIRKDLAVTESRFDEFGPLIRGARGEVLAENLGLLIANHREVTYLPFEYTQLARLGKIDENLILKKIRLHDYGLIILETNPALVSRSSRFSANFLDAVRRYYRLAGQKYGQLFFIPAK